jgi:hypothetical protein
MAPHPSHALTGSGPLSGLLRAALSAVVLVGAALLALFALLLTWAVTLGVALAVMLRVAFTGRARRPADSPPPPPAATEADAYSDADSERDTVAELESFHGSLDEFMRQRGDRKA